METELIGEKGNFFKELIKLRKNYSEIKPLFKDFYSSENPRATLERILETVKRNPAIDNLLKISKTYCMITRAEENSREKGWNYACVEAVKEMGVKVDIIGEENLSENGSILYVSNHPYGILDSAVLIGHFGSLLEKKGKETKIIGMNQLKLIKGIEEVTYFVNSTNTVSNKAYLRDSLNHLDEGGDIIIYPSGSISSLGLKEYPWKKGVNHFISHSHYVVPIWFSGPNHERIYNFLARHKKTEMLRNLFSLRESWNKSGKLLILNIGKPMPSKWIMSEIKDGKSRMEYLKKCAEALKVKA